MKLIVQLHDSVVLPSSKRVGKATMEMRLCGLQNWSKHYGVEESIFWVIESIDS